MTPTLAHYQETCYTTVANVLPGTPDWFAHVSFKLCGEVAELADHLHYHISHPNDWTTTYPKMAKEVGDVMWYIVMCSNELGASITTFFPKTGRVDCHTQESMTALVAELLLLVKRSGRYAELIGKAGRDSPWSITKPGLEIDQTRRYEMLECLEDCFGSLFRISTMIGYRFDQILQTNLDKCAGRKERGTTLGEGDDR